MSTIPDLIAALNSMGSNVTYHQETGLVCPCLTFEGFRDPDWHTSHPLEPVCNEAGIIPDAVLEFIVKAAVQPATRALARASQFSDVLVGDILSDDKIGIFPCEWGGNTLNFASFDESGASYVVYDGRRYAVVASDKLADIDGNPNHHWEVALRLIKGWRPV